jgi:nitrite reductase/ring-hydroxylating ferredoxin subunit
MPDESPSLASIDWTRVADAASVAPGRPIAVKIAGKHIALFAQDGRILACNNRCPHEGYPLVEGALDVDCRLTCNWHNWKFDLRTGNNEYGGDNLRVYPVKVEGDAVWLDLADPPADERIGRALRHLDEAMADLDAPRIAREVARLEKAGATAERAVAHAIVATHERLRYGMTHAYAGTEAWLRLRERLHGPAERLSCVAEALSHVAFDVRGEPAAPYESDARAWSAEGFAASVEAQDEAGAIALIDGALDAGLSFADLESVLTSAALAHYADFGHTLIYLAHVRRLIERLGPDVERPLVRCWVRSLVYATREDLLPDFREYGMALRDWPARSSAAAAGSRSGRAPSHSAFEGRSVREALSAALDAAGSGCDALYFALFEAAARQLLRFDERVALRTDNSVADNVGWLDFSHALTFAHALREQCARLPRDDSSLWPAGLLQLALFVGRNKSYLRDDTTSDAELARWAVDDETAFAERAMSAIVDHGIGLPIFPVHWLKTWTAIGDEIALGLPDGARRAGLAAVNRLLSVRFKQRHALRNARQALGFVEREG